MFETENKAQGGDDNKSIPQFTADQTDEIEAEIKITNKEEKNLVFSEQDLLVETGQRQKEEEKPLQA